MKAPKKRPKRESVRREPLESRVVIDPVILKFTAYLALERRRSVLTVEAYSRDLEEFGGYLAKLPAGKSPYGKEYPQLRTASTSDIRQYIMHLTLERKYGGATAKRKLASIKSLYKCMRLLGDRADNPATDIEGPPLEKKRPKKLVVEDVEKLLHTSLAGQSDAHRLRDHAIMELLYASGIRRAEVTKIDLGDVDLKSRVIQIHGKGKKERAVIMGDTAKQALEAYLRVRPRSSDEAFFLGRGGKRLTPKHIWRIFRGIYDVSGVTQHASPHTFRHSFATHLVENGADIETVRELLGHESLATTGVYLQLAMERKKRTYDEAHPRDRMKDR